MPRPDDYPQLADVYILTDMPPEPIIPPRNRAAIRQKMVALGLSTVVALSPSSESSFEAHNALDHGCAEVSSVALERAYAFMNQAPQANRDELLANEAAAQGVELPHYSFEMSEADSILYHKIEAGAMNTLRQKVATEDGLTVIPEPLDLIRIFDLEATRDEEFTFTQTFLKQYGIELRREDQPTDPHIDSKKQAAHLSGLLHDFIKTLSRQPLEFIEQTGVHEIVIGQSGEASATHFTTNPDGGHTTSIKYNLSKLDYTPDLFSLLYRGWDVNTGCSGSVEASVNDQAFNAISSPESRKQGKTIDELEDTSSIFVAKQRDAYEANNLQAACNAASELAHLGLQVRTAGKDGQSRDAATEKANLAAGLDTGHAHSKFSDPLYPYVRKDYALVNARLDARLQRYYAGVRLDKPYHEHLPYTEEIGCK